jgi:Rps23 Pro-64 3,4-dihydroxylase Tpa1-like proline 4-hydroxylase
MPHIVNNQPVGHDPSEIERAPSYIDFFEKVGNSSDNIKVIPGFLDPAEFDYLNAHIDERRMTSFVSQKDNDGNPTAWIHNYEAIIDKYNLIGRISDEIEKAYDITNVEPKSDRLNIARWDVGSKLTLHVDDLGYVTNNHLPTLVYLNDDYEGGELGFATHNIVIKPKKGDLIMFPGNMHYAHEVFEVISGTRYTVPVWFTIPENTVE